MADDGGDQGLGAAEDEEEAQQLWLYGSVIIIVCATVA